MIYFDISCAAMVSPLFLYTVSRTMPPACDSILMFSCTKFRRILMPSRFAPADISGTLASLRHSSASRAAMKAGAPSVSRPRGSAAAHDAMLGDADIGGIADAAFCDECRWRCDTI